MSGNLWSLIYIATFAVILIAVILLWQTFHTKRVAAAAVPNNAYRALAEEATAVARKNTDQQERIVAELADLRNRVAAIEKVLKDVG